MAEWPGNQSTAPILPTFTAGGLSGNANGTSRAYIPQATHYAFIDTDGTYKVVNSITNQLLASASDLTTAINNALTGLATHPSSGIHVVLAPGFYNLNGEIAVTSDYFAMGCIYPGTAYLKQTANASFCIALGGAGNVIPLRNLLYGLNIDGGSGLSVNSGGISVCGNNCTLRDVNVQNCNGDGIYANGVNAVDMFDLSLINCYVSDCTGKQYNFDTLCSDYDILQCRANGGSNSGIASSDGFSFANGAGRFRGCHAYFCGGFGFRNRSSGNKITDFVSCVSESNGTGLFYNATSGVGVRLTACAFYNNTTTDIELQNMGYFSIVGCSVTSTATLKGIDINACTSGVIIACGVTGPATAVVIEAGSNAITVAHCDLSGTSHDLTIDSSTGCDIFTNKSLTKGMREVNTADNNRFFFNDISGINTITIVGANSKRYHNKNVVTENGGTATILSAGTSVVVAHGLVATPGFIDVTPLGDPAGRIYVDTIGATNFTIHSTTAVGANTNVNWRAQVDATL